MSNLQVNDSVKHNFSNEHGVIQLIREDPQGYNYLVRWDDPEDVRITQDWYRADVLEDL